MNRLDTEAINQRSPYDVHYENEQYVFVTDNEDNPADGHLHHRGVLQQESRDYALYVQHRKQSAGAAGTIILALKDLWSYFC